MVIMNNLDWPVLSYYVIYYEQFWNVQKSHAANREGSFNIKYSIHEIMSCMWTPRGSVYKCYFWIIHLHLVFLLCKLIIFEWILAMNQTNRFLQYWRWVLMTLDPLYPKITKHEVVSLLSYIYVLKWILFKTS